MVTAANPVPLRDSTPRRDSRQLRKADVRQLAREVVAQHSHFHGRAGSFQFVQRDDTLVVRGCVPSFYLKQVLQTVLRTVDGVRSIDNQVDVVACDGLSSVRYD
jgi:hypothetical protein